MSLLNAYDGFIFDYGGVLVGHQTRADQEQMARVAGFSMEQFEELYWRDRTDYDQGLHSGIDYWHSMGKSAGKQLTLDQIANLVELDSSSWMKFDEPMWEFIDELKTAGKRVALLSNMPEDLGEALKARTGRLRRFHHVTLSYEVKSVKPSAAIYEDCLAGIKTAPSKTIFFDDKIANVKGAEMLGMSAIEFLNRDDVLARVRGTLASPAIKVHFLPTDSLPSPSYIC